MLKPSNAFTVSIDESICGSESSPGRASFRRGSTVPLATSTESTSGGALGSEIVAVILAPSSEKSPNVTTPSGAGTFVMGCNVLASKSHASSWSPVSMETPSRSPRGETTTCESDAVAGAVWTKVFSTAPVFASSSRRTCDEPPSSPTRYTCAPSAEYEESLTAAFFPSGG